MAGALDRDDVRDGLTMCAAAGACALLAAAGALGDRLVLIVALAAPAIVAADRLLAMLADRRKFEFCALLGRANALAYLGGAVPAQMQSFMGAPNQDLMAKAAILDVAQIGAAGAFVALFWAACEAVSYFGGYRLRGFVDAAFARLGDDPRASYSAIAPFLIAGGVFYAALIGANALSLSRLVLAPDEPGQQVVSSFAMSTWPLLAIACGACIGLRDRAWRIAPWLCLAAMLFAMFALGRRPFLMACAGAVLGFVWARDFRLGALTRWALLFLALPAAGWVVDYFHDLRAAIAVVGTVKPDYTFWDLVEANARFPQATDVTEATISRAYVIGYLARLMEELRPGMEFGGMLMARDAAMAVPSFLWPDKTLVIGLQGEAWVSERTGVFVADEAWSMVANGFADFRWWGAAATPVIGLGFAALCTWLAGLARHPFLALSAAGVLFASAVSVEMAATSATVLLRLLIVVAALAWAMELFAEPAGGAALMRRQRH